MMSNMEHYCLTVAVVCLFRFSSFQVGGESTDISSVASYKTAPSHRPLVEQTRRSLPSFSLIVRNHRSSSSNVWSLLLVGRQNCALVGLCLVPVLFQSLNWNL